MALNQLLMSARNYRQFAYICVVIIAILYHYCVYRNKKRCDKVGLSNECI